MAPVFSFWSWWLNAGGDFAEVFGQASHKFFAVRFVLDAIDARKRRTGGALPFLSCNRLCRLRPGRRSGLAFTRQGNFEAVGKSRKSDFQMRVISDQLLEGFFASFDDGGLQSRDRVCLQPRFLGQKTRYASRRRSQAGVGIDRHVQHLMFSGHGCSPGRRRTLPGNRGNSRGRRNRDGCCAGPCKWCNTFRKCSALPASRIARRRLDLPWRPSPKLYLSDVRAARRTWP